MSEWQQPPTKPDYRLVVDGRDTVLFHDQDGYLIPGDRDLTFYETELLKALGQRVRPEAPDEAQRLRAENAHLRTEIWAIDRDSSHRLDAERAHANWWNAVTMILAFALGALVMALVLRWPS